jgi:hypothetical protein
MTNSMRASLRAERVGEPGDRRKKRKEISEDHLLLQGCGFRNDLRKCPGS